MICTIDVSQPAVISATTASGIWDTFDQNCIKYGLKEAPKASSKSTGFLTSIDNDQDARIKNYYVNYSELNRITDIINSL